MRHKQSAYVLTGAYEHHEGEEASNYHPIVDPILFVLHKTCLIRKQYVHSYFVKKPGDDYYHSRQALENPPLTQAS